MKAIKHIIWLPIGGLIALGIVSCASTTKHLTLKEDWEVIKTRQFK
ncbi:MAG: hypothetical protein HY578_07310 [Nitrospinae bacterium]|nr:hypothetical protein [Nitrospinota bacterium]